MNERIKELIEQATSTVTVNHEGYMGRAYTSQEEVFDKEKFAELIVRECTSVAGKYIHENKYTENGVSDFWLNETIKEHFGVKE